jgi:hypothetical protein
MSYIPTEARVESQVSVVSNEPDQYRWYLCVEQMDMPWTCKQTTQWALLCEPTSRSITVPISRQIPKFLDKFILNATLTHKVRIVSDF